MPVVGQDGKVLVDGGIASPMPTRAVRKLGAEKVIAVDLLTCGSVDDGTPNTLVGTFIQAAMMMIRNSSKSHHYRADVVIEPATPTSAREMRGPNDRARWGALKESLMRPALLSLNPILFC